MVSMGAHQGNDDECRQECPKLLARRQVQSRPTAYGYAYPRRFQHCRKSYIPKSAAAKQPTTMPIRGDHSRHDGGARNMSAAIVNKVANATTGAAASEVLSGNIL